MRKIYCTTTEEMVAVVSQLKVHGLWFSVDRDGNSIYWVIEIKD